ncbi:MULTISPECIES: sulfurtransferase complex subunit TusB [Vibrio]|uniref:sulfurtransferase complex subunit TusB n=1 Tax=Vibrio TaxID=662 RepID=UPI001EFE2A87|nr:MULTISPECIES: sulfurtransferase complex subunit TusB [Vibrio]MCG9679165.1 sulfurtransferase complex subunit TusB [Vibrio sp. Isolate24]USD32826.1 sulfurtransferase complex subunit TusB [Vibrio sp. SCSIO 43186]USD45866.1 sulfurtransferase complex subunit TusB [Vibrio sp. SCSIO 43145]USD69951.1 sulfurtransferase complex subunit TusB [Vibrio sp. SCSIO 43139]USD94859.1 sulfurtransferase complex subunit TusB [Vibrio coralliilyticus]
MLHIVKSVAAVEEVRKVSKESDTLLFIENAVYALNPQHRSYPMVKGFNIAALRSDLEARGILNRVSPSVEVIGYDGFVDLTVAQETSLTWD